MTTDESPKSDRPAVPEGRSIADAGRIAEARTLLVTLDTTVFANARRRTRAEHRAETMRAIAGFFSHG
jgi:hypothetical protein